MKKYKAKTLLGAQCRHEPITTENSTVLGGNAKSYWPNLYFEKAQVRQNSLVGMLRMEEYDFHLAVPWRHPEDFRIPLKDCGKYAVRPKAYVGKKFQGRTMLAVRARRFKGVWHWIYELDKSVRPDGTKITASAEKAGRLKPTTSCSA